MKYRLFLFPMVALLLISLAACESESDATNDEPTGEDTITIGENLPLEESFPLDSASTAQMSIVEVLRGAHFGLLVDALDQAGLTEALEGEGPFTLFAPSGPAWDSLQEGELDALLLEENREQLRSLLLYHVAQSNLPTSGLTEQEQLINSMQGSPLRVVRRSDGVFVNNANVVRADIPTRNGTIHVIDQVLRPVPGGQ